MDKNVIMVCIVYSQQGAQTPLGTDLGTAFLLLDADGSNTLSEAEVGSYLSTYDTNGRTSNFNT